MAAAPNPLQRQPMQRVFRCRACFDTGLVMLDGGPNNSSLEELRKLAPCTCELGDGIRVELAKLFESGETYGI